MAVAIVLKGSFFFFAVLFSVKNNTVKTNWKKMIVFLILSFLKYSERAFDFQSEIEDKYGY